MGEFELLFLDFFIGDSSPLLFLLIRNRLFFANFIGESFRTKDYCCIGCCDDSIACLTFSFNPYGKPINLFLLGCSMTFSDLNKGVGIV